MKKVFLFLMCFVLFTSFSTPPLRVLFIGDSLTCLSGGWQDVVSKHYGYQSVNKSSELYRDWETDRKSVV